MSDIKQERLRLWMKANEQMSGFNTREARQTLWVLIQQMKPALDDGGKDLDEFIEREMAKYGKQIEKVNTRAEGKLTMHRHFFLKRNYRNLRQDFTMSLFEKVGKLLIEHRLIPMGESYE